MDLLAPLDPDFWHAAGVPAFAFSCSSRKAFRSRPLVVPPRCLCMVTKLVPQEDRPPRSRTVSPSPLWLSAFLRLCLLSCTSAPVVSFAAKTRGDQLRQLAAQLASLAPLEDTVVQDISTFFDSAPCVRCRCLRSALGHAHALAHALLHPCRNARRLDVVRC